jgi:hypothetical protein
MINVELLQALDRLKSIMIAVATGGPPIGTVEDEFAKTFDLVSEELTRRNVANPLPYRDLWEWYGRWTSGDLPSYQSRRSFVNALFGELTKTIDTKTGQNAPVRPPLVEPTGWTRVDRAVTEMREQLAKAENEEQLQTVGLLCREILISLGQAVFDPKKHPTLDGTLASRTDAKRMLEAYIAVAFAGSQNEYTRKHARAAFDLANHLQHVRTAEFRTAAACAEATTSIVNLIAIMAGLRDPAPPGEGRSPPRLGA